MNLDKIGKFIALNRKNKGLTQEQYAQIYLTNTFFHSKINTGNEETTKVVAWIICKKHISWSRQMCFFIDYFRLLIITTNAIIKPNVMVVTDTRPVKSNLIINNKVCTSTIRLTSSYVGGKPHLLILISYK